MRRYSSVEWAATGICCSGSAAAATATKGDVTAAASGKAGSNATEIDK
jgi:hypothetical protein